MTDRDSSAIDLLEPPAPLPDGAAGHGASHALYYSQPMNVSYPAKAPGERFAFLQPATGPGELGWLGNYRIFRTLGVGGMGYVFHAEDVLHGRQVALKVMKPDLDDSGSPELRFQQEARIMASIQHEHLVTVYHVGEANGVAYLEMELLQGQTLDRWLHCRGRAEPAELLRIGREIATGLAVIHGNGLLHRDLKPSNLWLESPGGRIKILDFGLARYVDSDIRLTQSDRTVGTPGFLAPEQARGDAVDARGDLFSLGTVLYCLCTGAPPFHASNTLAVLSALTLKDPPPPCEVNAEIPRPVSDYIMKLLAKKPEDRPADAQTVAATLRRYEAGDYAEPVVEVVAEVRRPCWRRWAMWVVIAVVAALAGVARLLT
jgi:eukaryotic-like serine/threonine-protein kinase